MTLAQPSLAIDAMVRAEVRTQRSRPVGVSGITLRSGGRGGSRWAECREGILNSRLAADAVLHVCGDYLLDFAELHIGGMTAMFGIVNAVDCRSGICEGRCGLALGSREERIRFLGGLCGRTLRGARENTSACRSNRLIEKFWDSLDDCSLWSLRVSNRTWSGACTPEPTLYLDSSVVRRVVGHDRRLDRLKFRRQLSGVHPAYRSRTIGRFDQIWSTCAVSSRVVAEQLVGSTVYSGFVMVPLRCRHKSLKMLYG